jgi:uncharacterized OsmC-like protein
MSADGVYTAVAETSTLGIKGRAVTRVRDRNLLVDDPALPHYDNGPGEELGATELFLAGITTCAALMIERIARAESIPYEHCSVRMEATRDMAAPRERGPQAMDSARVHFVWRGISDEHAAYLTDAFQNRCPLYGSVAIATPDTVVTHEVIAAQPAVA